MPLSSNDFHQTPVILFAYSYLYTAIKKKCCVLFFIIKALVFNHKHLLFTAIILLINAVSVSVIAHPDSNNSKKNHADTSKSSLITPSDQIKKLTPAKLRERVKELLSKSAQASHPYEEGSSSTTEIEIETKSDSAVVTTPPAPSPCNIPTSPLPPYKKVVTTQPRATAPVQYRTIRTMPNGDEIIQAQASGTPEQPSDDQVLLGSYTNIKEDGTQILVHDEAELSNRQVICLAITTCAVTEFGILNSLSFIGDNPTVGQVIQGAAQCFGINASIGVMFGDSYREAMTKILKKYNRHGFCKAFCGCFEGCCSGNCTCKKTAWIILPATAGIVASITDALNTQNGVLKVLNSCCSESLCTNIFSRVAAGVNLFSESFLYIKGTKGVWQGYTNMIGAMKHCDLPDEALLRKLLADLHESADTALQEETMTDISPQQATYLTEILEDIGKYRQFARLDKAFTEEKASGTPKLADAIEKEATWGKRKAIAHTAAVTTLLASISIYISMGMAAPVIKTALASGLGAKAIMSIPWPQAVSSFNCSWNACCGYTSIISYVVQAISLAPLAMQTVLNVITPLLMIPFLILSDKLYGSEELTHHWVALKDSLPTNWRGWFAGTLATCGTGMYMWAYSGVGTHIKTITTFAAGATVKPCLAGCYSCFPATPIIPYVGNAFIFCIMCNPSYRIWDRLLHSSYCCRCKSKSKSLSTPKPSEIIRE